MEKFEFLLGDWDMEYRVLKSSMSEAATGNGNGTFKKFLDDQYVLFDYSYSLTTGPGQAHAIYAWDEKTKLYRSWWFENSGNFSQATCNFLGDNGTVKEYPYGLVRIEFMGETTAGRVIFRESCSEPLFRSDGSRIGRHNRRSR